MPAVQRLRALLVGVTSGVLLASCLYASAPPVRRVLGGRVRTGEWISPYAYEVFVRAELARASGQLDRAVELMREAIASAPDDPFLLANLADTLAEAGRIADAEEVVRRGLADHPDSEALHLSQGDLLWRRGDADRALRAYGEAARVAPRSDEGPRAIADALERLGRRGEAVLVLERFVARAGRTAPTTRARLRLGALRGDHAAIAAALRALGRPGGGRRSELRALARGARLDDPALATTLYRFLVEHAPGDVGLRIEAISLALALGDVASVDVLRAPTTALPPVLEARVHLLRGDPELALRVLDEVRDLPATEGVSADDLEVRSVRVSALAMAGRDRDVIRLASSIAPGTRAYAAARITLATVLDRVAGPNAAMASLRAAFAVAPADVEVAWALAARVLAMGDETGARAVIDAARSPLLEARWADLQADGAAAARAWREVDPERVSITERQRVLAERALAAQRDDEAALRLTRAVALSPLDAQLALRAAEVLFRIDPSRAVAIARDASSIAGVPGETARRLAAIASRPVAAPRRTDAHPPALRARRPGSGSP